mmetsp:Transcript_91849/g.246412  ORF Transcript_91849/g.246412 Transcript_91849/m.246412 type:complete len:388 (+) Transcript_91849:59-1222(+)
MSMPPSYLPRPLRAALLAAALPPAHGVGFLKPLDQEISFSKGRHHSASRLFAGRRTLQWIQNQTEWLSDEAEWGQLRAKYGSEPGQLTGIVTHAGKRGGDYMDHAIMLGRSLSERLPEIPRVAITVEGISEGNKEALRRAGWHLVQVEDWGGEHCGEKCAANFLGRWADSFEKLHAFRVPFKRVLFMDADTYVFKSELRDVITSTDLREGEIAMVRDTCKPKGDEEEYNSGVMLYEPSLGAFSGMLARIAERSSDASNQDYGNILDQRIINVEYRGQVVELPDRFNCVDPGKSGPRCPKKCLDEFVVSHFTGIPKPTRADYGRLRVVRGGNLTAVQETCKGSNKGSCDRWPDFFCAMKKESEYLSSRLQTALEDAGECVSPGFARLA